VTRVKNDKRTLTDKVEDIARKRDELENYLGELANKLFLMLEGAFPCPTDSLLSTRYIAVDSSFYCVCRILPELRGRDWAN